MFVGKIVKTLGIWHLLQCNLLDWNKKMQNKKKIVENLGTFVRDPNFNIIFYYTFGRFMRGNKVVLNYSYHFDPL
jgi:hypothetical protein